VNSNIIGKPAKLIILSNEREAPSPSLERIRYKKRKRAGIYTLIFFFASFVEPYASKGACTAPKGIILS